MSANACKPCSTEGCQEPAGTLSCPTCIKLGLPPSFFCTQACFKANWKEHKKLHKLAEMMKAQAAPAKSSKRTRSDADLERNKFAGYKYTGSLRAAPLTEQKVMPDSIPPPDYHLSGVATHEEETKGQKVPVHTQEQIEGMRYTCRIAREVLDMAGNMVAPGVTGNEIDEVHAECIKRGVYPSPLNYYKFPKSVCVSVNEVVCHGIPDMRPLEEGDIVNLDVTVYAHYKGVGYHGDLNETYFVGKCDKDSHHLVKVAFDALAAALATVKPGAMYRDIGNVVTKVCKAGKCEVDRNYCGHGISAELFHTAPNIPHYAKNKAVGMMKVGHIFTIEPMVNRGSYHDELWPDEWTVVTQDGKRTAQFEHTILVTETGYELLTARLDSDGNPIPKMVWSVEALQRPLSMAAANSEGNAEPSTESS